MGAVPCQRARERGARRDRDLHGNLPLRPGARDARARDLGREAHAPLGAGRGPAAGRLVARLGGQQDHGRPFEQRSDTEGYNFR